MKSYPSRFLNLFPALLPFLVLILAAFMLTGLVSAYAPLKTNVPTIATNLAAPASQIGGPSLAITKQDRVNGGDGPARPGETIRYQVIVTNTDIVSATNVLVTDTVDSNTTLNAASLVASPLAFADSYETPPNVAVNEPAPGVLGNDWNDYNGTVTIFDATSVQGGVVAVDPDGSFVYTPPVNFSGPDSFSYTVANSAGSDTAVVTIQVANIPAVCVADVYTATGNIPISVAAPGVLDNDGGTQIVVTAVQGSGTNVGNATATMQGSSVTLNADGSFTYKPLAGQRTSDSFAYTVDNALNQPQTCTVIVNMTDMVWFIDNTAASSNEGTFDDPFQSIADFNTAAGPQAGDVIYIFRGSGYNEVDGINLQDDQQLYGGGVQFDTVFTAAPDSSPAYQTFAAAPAGAATLIESTAGDGVDLASSNSIGGIDVGDTPNGFAFDGSNVGSLAISDVNVVGSGGVMRITGGGDLGTAVTFGTLSSTSSPGAAIDLTDVNGTMNVTDAGSSLAGTAVNDSVVHIDGGAVHINYPGSVSKTNAGTAVFIENGHTGSLTFNGAIEATAGTGLRFDNADGSYVFSGAVTLNGGDAGIDILNGSAGSFTWNNASITDPSGKAFYLLNSNATVVYTGDITDADDLAVHIRNHDGGTVTFGGAAHSISSRGAGIRVDQSNGGTVTFNSNLDLATTAGTAAIYLNNNSGSTINFGGNIVINNTTTAGFRATNGGTVNATGTTSDITTTTAVAVRIRNADIGAGHVTFRSVSADGGTAAIILNNTGSAGGLHITGDGITAASGGTIQNTTGNSIRLTNTSHVSLAFIVVRSSGADAVNAVNVVGLSIIGSDISANGDGSGDRGLEAGRLTGVVSIVDSTFSGNAVNHIRVSNNSGVLSLFTVSSSTFELNNSPLGRNGIEVTATGTAVVEAVLIENNIFNNIGAIALRLRATDTAVIGSAGQKAIINNNNFYDNVAGISVQQRNSASITFDITNNLDMNGHQSEPIDVYSVNTSAGGTMTGRITGNSIGTSGAGSGSAAAGGIRIRIRGDVTAVMLLDNNTINNVSGRGLDVRRQNPAASAPDLDITITNNNIVPGAAAGDGVYLYSDDNIPLRANVAGNSVSSGSGGFDFALVENNSGGDIQLVGTAADCTTQIGNTNTAVNGQINESPSGSCTIIPGPINTAMSLTGDEFVVQAEEAVGVTAVYQINPRHMVSTKLTGTQLYTPDGISSDVTVSIPELPAGKAVTIVFTVTVNDPFPAGVAEVSNQAFASADGTSPVPSDDPDTGDFGDPTVTLIATTQFVYLPLIQNNYANLPDLVVTSITPTVTDVAVVLTNQGNAPVTDAFWVDVYFNPNPPPTAVNQTIDTLNVEGLVWGVTSAALPLNPGDSLTLTTASPYYDAVRSRFSGIVPAGTVIYAQVDSANTATNYGAVLETHEATGAAYNNITGPVTASSPISLTPSFVSAFEVKKGGLVLRPSPGE